MGTTTVPVRLPAESRDALKGVAEAMDLTMQDALVRMIAEAENRLFFRKMDLGYQEMQADPEALAAETGALERLDELVGDGLEEVSNGAST